ncbi:MAG: 30S ribosomal protein S2 [Bdellovibrionales bacterium RIFOXYD12_FULL_39_22]|nr:MAG: 30S ribosomal protein S2 [Bdellovibrionales bacterium RIFOXYB1_FULL_39_21]OFZ41948.1 MAG: 30S ribosomal protein S2 [Bdellovibrionales bacterium RIFOXYC12_FULL_39_17]OFZ50664.1 MAG: 30S ribosomal protein S2 [Bdellovibrionales bacterium RIFOXYC1_FULL_39_130]OFZ77887.1 MAG: 30S ribosomal protein S2 [Bdellovibrionales bacterium RIFOXYD1_FULL_39_84]OFZ93677.1 MAG: 30S ribosomal protein S2 [Bdellovibrionales bacterium RIFOXYD12_FULL_39_22]HLE10188.1 30S ribosomal protein S2 [Bacteriovoracace
MSTDLSLKQLLEAGAHFGHQTNKWNPKMKKYVYGERNGIYIIDLGQTIPMAKRAYEFIKKTSQEGKPVLFVGTKRQASETVRRCAEQCGAFHVTHRWLGGMLTNFKTIALSVDKLRKVEKMKETGDFELLTKKERAKIEKDIEKLEKNLGGIKNMRKLPGAIFLVDPNAERIVITEAETLKIPVIAVTDTNCDPTGISYVVPGNDDAIKSITLFAEYFAQSVSEGTSKATRAKTDDPDRDLSLESEILAKYEADIDLLEEGAVPEEA